MSDFRYYRPNAFPPVVKNLLIINGLVFLLQMTFQNNATFDFERVFALHDVRSVFFKPHQIVTHLFMHGGFSHILFNMFASGCLGKRWKTILAPSGFLTFYMVSGLGAAFCTLAYSILNCSRFGTLFCLCLPRSSPISGSTRV
jgi:membrane associated rhomboid family serine protease